VTPTRTPIRAAASAMVRIQWALESIAAFPSERVAVDRRAALNQTTHTDGG
jgi:hypothetical protein